jgi:glutamyl-tRNA reductase
MSLVLVGLNHKTAPLPVRERVVYSPKEAEEALRELKDKQSISQAILLSTCNRTELYAVVPDAQTWAPRMKEAFFFERLAVDNGSAEQFLYQHEDAKAVEHLFRVACGLDSMVLGEQEILGQVKTAYEISRSADTVGTVFHRLASRAFRVGKRARTETRINEGAVSVAYAASELAEKVFQSLEGRGALLVGAGENGALCAQHLISRGVEPFLVANRTHSKAEELAQQLQGEAVPMDRLREAMARVDVVISTTGAPEPIIDTDLAREAMRLRSDRNLVLVDIAVPRDVDPAVDNIRNLFRFDMDALKSIVDQTFSRRRKEVPDVERLVESEVQGFMSWWTSLGAGIVIRDLHRAFEAIREVEVKKNAKRFTKEGQEQLEAFSRNLMRKTLMGITTEIKKYRPTDPIEMERLAVLRHVFHLDEEEDEDVGQDSD